MALPRIFNPMRWLPSPAAVKPRQKQRGGDGGGRRIRASRFDAAMNAPETRNHWALADSASIDASASQGNRVTLRTRSRYEYHNNGYYAGIAETVANYTIGTGPQLQMRTPDKGLNQRLQKLWAEWAAEIALAMTLKSNRVARMVSGESFDVMRTNPNLYHPVKLDVFELECDQVASPLFGMYPAQYADQFFDGKILDPWGRPETYHILRQHPGALGAFAFLGYEFDPWPARYVLHDYKRLRPGQQRGIPESTPVLNLFANLRRYDVAVLGAAETAAELSTSIQTDAAADSDDVDTDGEEGDGSGGFGAMDMVPMKSGMGMVMPAGWKMNQLKAEQPTTTYDGYVTTVLRQIARGMNLPLMFVTLDAMQANMSSAYVVGQPFAKAVQADRSMHYEPMLDRIFDEFLTEAIRIPGLLPDKLPEEFPHAWRWPRIGQHADPSKVATAQGMALSNGVTSIPIICAEDGHDWEEVMESNAKAFGFANVGEYQAALREKVFSTKGSPAPASEVSAPDDEPTEPGDGSTTDPVEEDDE